MSVGIDSILYALERCNEVINYCTEALTMELNNKNTKNGLFSLCIDFSSLSMIFYFNSIILYFQK